ncbi:MAG: NAD(P)-dependent alcohol dehydrogenase [Bauldia sp.]
MKIRAAVVRARHAPMTIETLDLDDPRDDEIVVRLVATGVCHTDIAMRDQTFPVPQPIVLGHEGAGIVERVGHAVTKVAAGDHVVMTYNSCGHCASCDHHAPTYCHQFFEYNFGGSRPDGSSPLSRSGAKVHGNFFGQSSFASHAICRERNIVKVPRDAPLDLIGPLACGIQTGAGSVINGLKVGVGDSIAVFGSGSVGLSAVMAARLVGAGTIIAVDLLNARLELARELGATHVVNGTHADPVTEIMKITGSGVDFALEFTGVVPVVRQAMMSLAPRGACGVAGAFAQGSEVTLDVLHLMTAGRSIRGLVEGESNADVFIPHLIEMHRQGRFPFDRLIRHYDFDDINAAIADSETGVAIKPVVRMASA